MIIVKYQNKAWKLLLKAIDCSNKYHQENCVIVATDLLFNSIISTRMFLNILNHSRLIHTNNDDDGSLFLIAP